MGAEEEGGKNVNLTVKVLVHADDFLELELGESHCEDRVCVFVNACVKLSEISKETDDEGYSGYDHSSSRAFPCRKTKMVH